MKNESTADAEHGNPVNWHYTFYYVPNDPRVVVPKRWSWKFGATLNFARPAAYLILLTPAVLGAVIIASVLLFAR